MHRFLLVIMMIVLLLNSSCIHTNNYENKTINLSSEKTLVAQKYGDLQIESIIYLPAKLPLSRFFYKLKRGEFTRAFERIDLNYEQSNVNDEALTRVFEDGFVPVYVEIKNLGAKTIFIDEKSFALEDGESQVKAFYSKALPREFEKINPTAIAANIVNTGIVVVGFAAVLVALAIVEKNSGGGRPDLSHNSPGSIPFNSDVYNPTSKKTKVDYNSYLISATKIAPGASVKGLLFFYFKDKADFHNFKLILIPNQELVN